MKKEKYLEFLKKSILEKSPSISEVDLGDMPEKYEGYLYKFTVLNGNYKDKVYLGVHKGSVGDGYWQSASDKEFKKIFTSSETKLRYEILEYGDYDYMTSREHKILSDNEARTNDNFINKYNGHPKFVEPDTEKMQELFDKIHNKEFIVTKENKEKIYNLKRLQVRAEDFTEHRKNVKEKIDEANGNTDKCFPIVIYEGRSSGADIIGDGNHTINAAYDSKYCVDVPVIRIPSEYHSKFTDEELKGVSLWLNKKPEIEKVSMTVADAVKYIVGVCEKSTAPYDSNNNKVFLEKCGFPKAAITRILKKVKQEIEDNNFAASNKLWIHWDTPENKKKLQTRIQLYNQRDTNTICIALSSAMFRWDTIWNTLYESAQIQKQDKQKRKSNLVIIVHHKNTEWRDKWDSGLGAEIFNKLKFHLKESQKEPYTIELIPMETTMINDLN
jgi:hypothetical protein